MEARRIAASAALRCHAARCCRHQGCAHLRGRLLRWRRRLRRANGARGLPGTRRSAALTAHRTPAPCGGTLTHSATSQTLRAAALRRTRTTLRCRARTAGPACGGGGAGHAVLFCTTRRRHGLWMRAGRVLSGDARSMAFGSSLSWTRGVPPRSLCPSLPRRTRAGTAFAFAEDSKRHRSFIHRRTKAGGHPELLWRRFNARRCFRLARRLPRPDDAATARLHKLLRLLGRRRSYSTRAHAAPHRQ